MSPYVFYRPETLKSSIFCWITRWSPTHHFPTQSLSTFIIHRITKSITHKSHTHLPLKAFIHYTGPHTLYTIHTAITQLFPSKPPVSTPTRSHFSSVPLMHTHQTSYLFYHQYVAHLPHLPTRHKGKMDQQGPQALCSPSSDRHYRLTHYSPQHHFITYY